MIWESSGVSEKFYGGGGGGWWWYIAIIESALGPDLESREIEWVWEDLGVILSLKKV